MNALYQRNKLSLVLTQAEAFDLVRSILQATHAHIVQHAPVATDPIALTWGLTHARVGHPAAEPAVLAITIR